MCPIPVHCPNLAVPVGTRSPCNRRNCRGSGILPCQILVLDKPESSSEELLFHSHGIRVPDFKDGWGHFSEYKLDEGPESDLS